MNHTTLIDAGHLTVTIRRLDENWSSFELHIAPGDVPDEEWSIERTEAARALCPHPSESDDIEHLIRTQVWNSMCDFLRTNHPAGFHARLGGEGWTIDGPAPIFHLFPHLSKLKNANLWIPEITRSRDEDQMWLGAFVLEPNSDPLHQLCTLMTSCCELSVYSLWSARPCAPDVASLLYGNRQPNQPFQLDVAQALPYLSFALFCTQFDDAQLIWGVYSHSMAALANRLLSQTHTES